MPRPLPESAKRLEELLVAHGEKSEQAMQELAKEFSTELQTVGSKIVTELKGVIEAIQKIGVESTQEQPDVSAGNPFGLEATGGEVAAGLGFPPQMPSASVLQPPPPPTVKQGPCPALSVAAPSAPMTPVTTTPLPVTRKGGEAVPWVMPHQPRRSGEAVPCVCVFVGFSPKEVGGTRMTNTLTGVEVPRKKPNPVLMKHQDNTYLLASPTARQGTPSQ